MNYRHAYHAGNFADLLKHAVLTELLSALTGARPPLTVIDTHAGAGLYDLEGGEARRTGEGAAGIGCLMAAKTIPSVFDVLKAAVERVNEPPAVRFYPGSPLVVAGMLRQRDRYIGCEFRPDDHAALRASMSRESGATILKANGWIVASDRIAEPLTPLLLVIDPPYERGDDDDQAIRLVRLTQRRNPKAVIAIWAPIKDLASFDGFVMALVDAAAPAPVLLAEVRLRPLSDPMRMNGCAMIIANPPSGLDERSRQATEWIALNLGEAGGMGRVERVALAG